MDFEKRLKEMSELKNHAPLFSMEEISQKLDMLEDVPKSKKTRRGKMALATGISVISVLTFLLYPGDKTGMKESIVLKPNKKVENITQADIIKPAKVDKKNESSKTVEGNEAEVLNKKGFEPELKRITIISDDSNSDSTERMKFVLFDKVTKDTIVLQTEPFKIDPEVKKSEEEWKAAVEGRILSLPTISSKEAEALGIVFDGQYMSYILEYYDRFYPISYKRNKYYRKESKVQSIVNQGYPLDNSLFLYKKLIIADLGQSLEEIKHNVERYDAVAKKVLNLDKRGIDIPVGKKLRRGIYCDTIMKYDGTTIDDYSMLAPVYVFMESKGEVSSFKLSRIHDRTVLMKNRYDSDLKNLNTFMPVKIELPEDYSPSIKSVVFWFAPSQELFSKLPKEIGDELKRQYEIYQLVENGEMSKSEACGEVNEKDYLGLCGLSNKDFSILKIFPNPVKDKLTIDLDINKKDQYRVDIFDQSGKQVKLSSIHFLENGSRSIDLDLSKLPFGLYFIRISNSEDNYITSRIIKE